MELMEPEIAAFEPIPYRIRIGVTGHRRLKNPVALRTLVRIAIDAEVESLFSEAVRGKANGPCQAGALPILFSVLSPLAEGSDRVVARAILDYPEARLDAILPLVVEDYLEDFATEESREEFHDLLNQSGKTVILRTRPIRDECSDPAGQAELRLDAYEQVGRYVVDHSDVLIAVWDGRPSCNRGGTAEIVRYALSKNRPILRLWEDSITVLNRINGQVLFVES